MAVIGIDFDNTIVKYDIAFFKAARDKNLVPPDFSVNKIKIRNYLRDKGKESDWIDLQGEVYGSRMNDATIFDGFFDFLQKANAAGHKIVIVSHKTKYPYQGKKIDLHAAAVNWATTHLRNNNGIIIPSENIHFKLTKAEKIKMILALTCDYFIDDLPEIFVDPDFPKETRPLLFDPDNHYSEKDIKSPIIACHSWEAICQFLKL